MDIFPTLDFQRHAPQYSSPAYFVQTSRGFGTTESDQDHPSFWHLVALVCEAVLEVVCISSLGFIAAKKGIFPAKVQKDLAALNIYFFTPCLIFSKLSAQLTGEKLTELWIIPVILFAQTTISWAAAEISTRLIKLNKKPQRNFVTAMAVFGNSNSLPLSLVISLSHTISGLHWDQVPNDNDDEVGARGILYLLCFSQLGQAVRWSWGMNSLLRPIDDYTPAERGEIPRDEEDQEMYKDDEEEDDYYDDSDGISVRPDKTPPHSRNGSPDSANRLWGGSSSGSSTPVDDNLIDVSATPSGVAEPYQRNPGKRMQDPQGQPRPQSLNSQVEEQVDGNVAPDESNWFSRQWKRAKRSSGKMYNRCKTAASSSSRRAFHALPQSTQKSLRSIWFWVYITVTRFMGCLNVPLAAIILSVIVGGVPSIRAFFHTPDTFVYNTVTTAINQMAGVAVPVILFVLGGNLCKSAITDDDTDTLDSRREERQMMWCALASRMLIPLLIMGPLLALLAKFAPISILDDPIFIIVCFLLLGAPSALQLAQICQVNDVFVPVISQLLVQSYVVWIFPSTIVLVMLALEVVKWAQ